MRMQGKRLERREDKRIEEQVTKGQKSVYQPYVPLSIYRLQYNVSLAWFQTVRSSCCSYKWTWDAELHDIKWWGGSNKVSDVALGFIQNTQSYIVQDCVTTAL